MREGRKEGGRARKKLRAGHTKEARVENPAETSAPDPERANEMLVLRCPPSRRQASNSWFLGLQPGSRNGQIAHRYQKRASDTRMRSKPLPDPGEPALPVATRCHPSPAPRLLIRRTRPFNP